MFTDFWAFVLAWYNLPFSLLFGLCVLLAALQLVGLGGEQDTDHDADADVDHDIDHDFDHDADADADHDLDHDADAAADHNADHDADSDVGHSLVPHSASLPSLLAFLGAGKAPLLVILLILFGTTGLLGWIANSLVLGILGTYAAAAFGLVLPLTLVVSAFTTSRAARFIGRALPPLSTTASNAQSLVGRVGTVISPFIDLQYGQVHLRDSGGTLISVFAVNESEEPIKRGDKVVLVSYKAQRKCYTVIRSREAP